jgi:hypothetical protein
MDQFLLFSFILSRTERQLPTYVGTYLCKPNSNIFAAILSRVNVFYKVGKNVNLDTKYCFLCDDKKSCFLENADFFAKNRNGHNIDP